MLTISQILKKSGHQIFINITTIIGVSLCWSLFVLPAIFLLPVHWAILFLALTAIPATCSAFAVLHEVTEGKKKPFGAFFRFFLQYMKKAWPMGMIYTVAMLIPFAEWWYYANVNSHYGVFLFSIFQTYLCVMFLTSQVYAIPFLVMGERSAFSAMNASIRHFLARPWYTIGLFVQIASVTVLLSFTVIGFFLLFIGIIAVFVLNAAKNSAQGNADAREAGTEQPA